MDAEEKAQQAHDIDSKLVNLFFIYAKVCFKQAKKMKEERRRKQRKQRQEERKKRDNDRIEYIRKN